MAKIKNETDITTPARPPTLKKSTSSAGSDKNQRSILGFFSKAAPTPNGTQASAKENSKPTSFSSSSNGATKSSLTKVAVLTKARAQNLTPVPSSDAAEPSSQEDGTKEREGEGYEEEVDTGLPSPMTPAESNIQQAVKGANVMEFSSPSRRVRIRSIIF